MSSKHLENCSVEDVPQVVPPMMGVLSLLLYSKNLFHCCCKFFHLVWVHYFGSLNAHLSWWPGMGSFAFAETWSCCTLKSGLCCSQWKERMISIFLRWYCLLMIRSKTHWFVCVTFHAFWRRNGLFFPSKTRRCEAKELSIFKLKKKLLKIHDVTETSFVS